MLIYRSYRKDLLALAATDAGRPVSIAELFANDALMGLALSATQLSNGQTGSKTTIAHRRTVLRSVATLLNPELTALLGEDPHDIIVRASREYGGVVVVRRFDASVPIVPSVVWCVQRHR